MRNTEYCWNVFPFFLQDDNNVLKSMCPQMLVHFSEGRPQQTKELYGELTLSEEKAGGSS